jgi:hypothetical protein
MDNNILVHPQMQILAPFPFPQKIYNMATASGFSLIVLFFPNASFPNLEGGQILTTWKLER